MKKTGIIAVLLAAALTAAFSGCSDSNDSSVSSRERRSSTVTPAVTEAIGSNVVNGEIGKEMIEKDTAFTLNSVVGAVNSETGEKFIYMDITLRNSTNDAYTLSTLNNFYIELPDGRRAENDIRTQLYAKQHFKDDKYYADPFDIPSNGQFSGLIGGIPVSGDTSEFELCFYPTGSDQSAKGTVIKYSITAADITAPSADIVK